MDQTTNHFVSPQIDYQKLAFDFCPAAIVVLSQRRIMQLNPAFEQLFGYTRAELIGQSIAQLFPSIEDYEKVGADALLGLLQSNRVFYSDQRFMQHQNGELFWTRTQGQTLTPEAPFQLMVWHFERHDRSVSSKQQLTQRESEITQWIVNGFTCKEIAKKLNLSHRTVETHKANAMKKLDARNKAELSAKIIIQ